MNKSTLQALVDSYEDIPALMSRIRDGNVSKTTRFHPGIIIHMLCYNFCFVIVSSLLYIFGFLTISNGSKSISPGRESVTWLRES